MSDLDIYSIFLDMDDIYGHMTDEEVVRMTLQDAGFFEYIVTRYEDKLSRYLIRLGVRNKVDREDVLQEVFLKALRQGRAFTASATPGSRPSRCGYRSEAQAQVASR